MTPPAHIPTPSARQVPLDYASLASYMVALGYPARLELLDLLRFPSTLGAIKLIPHRADAARSDRVAARETIRAHLDKLAEVGLVRVERIEEAGQAVNRYAVNLPKLYALLEDLRRLCTLYAAQAPAEPTGTLVPSAGREQPHGPRLVLVHGVYEGKAFPLDPRATDQKGWVIGRAPGLPVTLDYDPFVSAEHASVSSQGGRYFLTDLEESKNGTFLNWVPLAKGEAHPIRAGDVIGVGRSLLCLALE